MAISPGLFKFDDEDTQRREDLYKFAQLSPQQQETYRSRDIETGIEGGVQQALGGAIGVKPQQDTRRQAMIEIQTLSRTVQPGTPEFYSKAAAIFQKYDMPREAEQMTLKKRELESQSQTGEHEIAKLNKLLPTLPEGPAKEAVKRKLAQIGTDKAGSAAKPSKESEIWDRYQAAVKAGNTEEANYWKSQFPGGEKGLTAWQKIQDARAQREEDRKAAKDRAEAEQAKEGDAFVLRQASQLIDNEIRSAKRLLNHPGLSKVVGTVVGQTETMQALAEALAGSGALALLKNVTAQTFIRALQELKATSSRGASGLGQLTEKEGDKIQNAKAALFPGQPVTQFMRTLEDYVQLLEGSYMAFANKAATMKVQLPARRQPIFDPAPKGDSDKPARRVPPTKQESKEPNDGWQSELVE